MSKCEKDLKYQNLKQKWGKNGETSRKFALWQQLTHLYELLIKIDQQILGLESVRVKILMLNTRVIF